MCLWQASQSITLTLSSRYHCFALSPPLMVALNLHSLQQRMLDSGREVLMWLLWQLQAQLSSLS